jgi:hypothetical protein
MMITEEQVVGFLDGNAGFVSVDQWKFTNLPEFLKKCCADIYNADETSLFYCSALVCILELEMCSCIWFNERSGLCNFCCAVQTCQKVINRS